MRSAPTTWPSGSGQWNRIERYVLADGGRHASDATGATFVATPLELILRLERCNQDMTVVLLSGQFAAPEVVAALRDIYPAVDIEMA